MNATTGLEARLSKAARVCLPPTPAFDHSDLRWTEVSRPIYSVAVQPATIQDVVETVKYAREHKIDFAARSGHHCVTTTMGRLLDGMLIDMRNLNAITLDANKHLVTIGGGTIADDFARHLEKNGFELTIGSCPTTGVMGIALGAGLGRLQGKYGYMIDNLVSCKLVLADGSLVTASEHEHSDLFWAIRGAGHNFGLVVEATFKVYPQQHGGRQFTWDIEFSLDRGREVFALVNKVQHSMPAHLAMMVLWQRESSRGVWEPQYAADLEKNLILINLVWSGPEEEADEWIGQFEALGPVYSTGKKALTWSELPWVTYGGMNNRVARHYRWRLAPNKMMGAVSVNRLDVETTMAFFESLRDVGQQCAGKGWVGAMFEVFSHEKVQQYTDESTAFPWRFGSNVFVIMTGTPVKIEDRQFFEQHLDSWKQKFIQVSGYGRLQQYVNYANSTASLVDPLEAIYGYEPWRLERLRALKAKYDAENVFRWYQPIV